MDSTKVLQIGGRWEENIGLSFIDLGSKASILEAVDGNCEFHFTSELTQLSQEYTNPLYDLGINVDYIVIPGTRISYILLDKYMEFFNSMKSKGTEIIINGGSIGMNYNKETFKKASERVKKINPYLFISRDKQNYDEFKEYCQHSYNGIDCGFFISDHFNPMTLEEEYTTVTFDRGSEPETIENDITGKRVRLDHLPFEHTERGMPVASNALHQINRKIHEKTTEPPLLRKGAVVSYHPDDYLNLYANTNMTYSDRVHACVATLSFGNPAQLFWESSRAQLFDRINASDILERPVEPFEQIKQQKSEQVDFLREHMN